MTDELVNDPYKVPDRPLEPPDNSAGECTSCDAPAYYERGVAMCSNNGEPVAECITRPCLDCGECDECEPWKCLECGKITPVGLLCDDCDVDNTCAMCGETADELVVDSANGELACKGCAV